MPASLIEQLLARVEAVLTGATAAGAKVFRGRYDNFTPEEMPAINIRRANNENALHAQGAERQLVGLEIDFHAPGDTWETQVDALHMEAHALLGQDAELQQLVSNLRCAGTDAQGESAEQSAGRITARYQAQVLARASNLAKAIN